MHEFNELPHVFEARMQASQPDATAYIKQFPAPIVTLLAFFVSFIVSSFAAVLLVLSALNENVGDARLSIPTPAGLPPTPPTPTHTTLRSVPRCHHFGDPQDRPPQDCSPSPLRNP